MSHISGAPPNPIHDGILVSNIRETSAVAAVPSDSGEMKRDTNHEAWRAWRCMIFSLQASNAWKG